MKYAICITAAGGELRFAAGGLTVVQSPDDGRTRFGRMTDSRLNRMSVATRTDLAGHGDDDLYTDRDVIYSAKVACGVRQVVTESGEFFQRGTARVANVEATSGRAEAKTVLEW